MRKRFLLLLPLLAIPASSWAFFKPIRVLAPQLAGGRQMLRRACRMIPTSATPRVRDAKPRDKPRWKQRARSRLHGRRAACSCLRQKSGSDFLYQSSIGPWQYLAHSGESLADIRQVIRCLVRRDALSWYRPTPSC
jgi:hypothetical protein